MANENMATPPEGTAMASESRGGEGGGLGGDALAEGYKADS